MKMLMMCRMQFHFSNLLWDATQAATYEVCHRRVVLISLLLSLSML